MKRLSAILLSVLLLFELSPAVYAAEAVDKGSSSPVTNEIHTAADFLDFAEKCSRDVYSKEAVFSLTSDIDLSSSAFHGVPYFAGTFLGNGHRILGVNLSADGSRQGLFRRVADGAVIRDLNVNGSVKPGGSGEYVGGLVGVNAGQIIQCSFTGSVEGLSSTGGIVGVNEVSGTVDLCSFSGDVSCEHQSGGICGENRGVISNCTNNGRVNITAIVPKNEAHFDLAILSEDDFLDLTNIGGIAGSNEGILSSCRNTGDVGYMNTGYNVGGIAGKSSGFVTACENSGRINGRRDVGGIVGQLIPHVRWDFSNDKLEALSGQLGSLNYLINKATQHTTDNTSDLAAELSRMNGLTSGAISALKALMQSFEGNDRKIIDSFHVDPVTGEVSIDPVDLSALNTGALTSALSDINAETSVLSGILHSSFDDLTEDMTKIVRQMSGVLGSMYSLLDSNSEAGLYEKRDLSSDEAYEHDVGAAADCVNYGEIHAENNAGGIIGTIGFEVSFDMEDSLDASKFITSDASQLVFAVARDCKSYCDVQVKSDHAGCVIGSMSAGAAVSCVGIGAASSQDGDYVGGIAGEAQGVLRSCWARCVLSGGKYVGGIAGYGKDLDACRCWTHVEEAREYVGAVAGWSDGIVSGNLYVDSSPAGIDGVSFSGQTDPVSEKELLAEEGLPNNFNDLTVTFLVDGNAVSSCSVPFGGSISELPLVENDGQRYWKWNDFNRDHIYYSMTVEGKYYAPGTTLSSDEEIPLFLVEGVFYEDQDLTVARFPVDEKENDVLAAYTLFVEGYDGELIVHMLSEEKGNLFLLDEEGNRSSLPYKADGKYIVFRMNNGSSFLYVQSPQISEHNKLTILCAVTLLILSIIIVIIIRRRKRKLSAAESMENVQEDSNS